MITGRDFFGIVDGPLEYGAIDNAQHSRPLSGYDKYAVTALEAEETAAADWMKP